MTSAAFVNLVADLGLTPAVAEETAPQTLFTNVNVLTYFRQHINYGKHIADEWFGNHEVLIGFISMPGYRIRGAG